MSGSERHAAPRGRPRRDDDRGARQALLEAAERCLLNKDMEQIGIREIAAQAGINSALISYYFSSKQGLFTALYEQIARTLQGRLQQIEQAIAPEGPCVIQDVVAAQVDVYLQHSNLFRLIRHELLDVESDMFRVFEHGYNSLVYGQLVRIVERLVAVGLAKPDLQPRYCAYMIAALCGHPFIMQPLFQKISGLSFDVVSKGDWTRYVARVVADHLYVTPRAGRL